MSLESFAWATKNLYEVIRDGRIKKKKELHELLSALWTAYRHTDHHIKSNTVDGIDQASIDISDYWQAAADKLRIIDAEAARSLQMKSEYWVDPNGFILDMKKGERGFDFRIRLDEVYKSIKGLERYISRL